MALAIGLALGLLGGTTQAPAQVPACVGEGQGISGKAPGFACCPGLVRIETDRPGIDPRFQLPGMLPGCMPSEPPDAKVCTRCGDGQCGPGENRCNCPADCKGP